MTTCTPKKRNAGLIAGGVICLLIGLVVLQLALRGLQGRGSAADVATTWPNLVTGLASLIGGMGYLTQRKWAVWVFLVAVIGHFVSHGMLIAQHGGQVGGLWVMPLFSLILLAGMVNCRRCGRLV